MNMMKPQAMPQLPMQPRMPIQPLKPGRTSGYSVTADWLGTPPEIDESSITEEYIFDVVVVGGGHSGTQAALAAAQKGASVAVLEKHTEEDVVYRGDDICSYNSKLLESWGFGPYDLKEITNEYVRRANGRCNPDVIRAFVYNSGEMMDNLVSVVPETSDIFDYENGACIVQVAYGKPSGKDYPIESEGYKMWASTVQTIGSENKLPVGRRQLTGVSRLYELEIYCREKTEDLGGKWFFDTSAQVLTRNSSGTVTGVIGKRSDGSLIRFRADKGVILAAGDFGGNPEMVWALCTEVAEYAERVGIPKERVGGMTDCTGDGQRLGCWAGGMLEAHPRPASIDAPHLGFGPWGTTPCLWLNSLGQRFTNEALSGFALTQSIRQPMETPQSFNFSIMDRRYMEYIQRAGLDHGAPNWGFLPGIEDFMKDMENLDIAAGSGPVTGLEIANCNPEHRMPNFVFAGNTPEEAMRNAGVPENVIPTALASISRYNELCHLGSDEDYGKRSDCMIPIEEGPFYIGRQDTGGLFNCGLNTLAGLIVNGNMQVMNAKRTAPIPGLYAVGNCMGQRYGNGYSCPSAGNNMGNAMTTGRIAGIHCAGL